MRNYCFSAVLFLFLLVPASITWAQTITQQKGLLTITFTIQEGSVEVYLPDDLRKSEMFSGTVNLHPGGNNPGQVQRNLEILKSTRLKTGASIIPLNNAANNFSFQINSGGEETSQVAILNSKNETIQELKLPAFPVSRPLQSSCLISSHVLAGSPLRIQGSFDGNSTNTQGLLDNSQPLSVLAESKWQCFVFYPENAKGEHTISVSEHQVQLCNSRVTGVELTVTAGKLHLRKGENTTLHINITGLQTLNDTAYLSIINNSVSTISVQPSNSFTVPIMADSGLIIYSRTVEIQSIRTGNFSVTVNLDLPEGNTQPLPNNSTPEKCLACNCSCKAVILVGKTEEGVTSFSVKTDAACTGQFGLPPCKACGIIDAFIYEWTISFSAGDEVDFVGSNKSSSVKIKNVNKAPYTLTATVKITCNDGSTCTCTAVFTNREPEVPVTYELCPGCMCECDAEIHATDTEGEEWEYIALVKAFCAGKFGEVPCKDCSVQKIEYQWKLNDNNVIKIVGSSTGQSVKLRTIKPGKFVISVTVTVTCSDGKQCVCSDSQDEIVPDKGCMLTWIEMAYPAMTANISADILKTHIIKRDEFIGLKVTGEDEDYIKLTCTKLAECLDLGSVKFEKLPGSIKFEWLITGPGQFVLVGCMGESKTYSGEQVIFKPPFVPLPVAPAKETIISTTIQLTVSDPGIGNLKDADIVKTLVVTTKRTTLKENFYTIEIKEKKLPVTTKTENTAGNVKDCFPVKKWTDVKALEDPEVIFPGVKDSDKLLPGQMIRLEAKFQEDQDLLEFDCQSNKNKCTIWRHYKRVFADKLKYTWKTSHGTFVGSNTASENGTAVIFLAPEVTEKTKITIRLSVDDAGACFDDKLKSKEVFLTVYPCGIKLDYPKEDWVPDPKIPAEIRSYLVYKDEEKWVEAFEHTCRILFFELLNVSNQPGICLNSPERISAKHCRDLKINKETGQETFLDTSFIPACNKKGYFMQARTELPVRSYTIKIYPEDYGAFGFLRSFANINSGGEVPVRGEFPSYKSIPVKKDEVKHPQNGVNGEDRSKRTEYTDNRINLPMDIDENHIPDNGWIISKTAGKGGTIAILKATDFTSQANTDAENNPEGDKWPGDGISFYEEYRGFMVNKPTIEHRRLDPSKKELFIHNRDNLPVSEFTKTTGVPVHEISATQYDAIDEKYFRDNYRRYIKNNHRFVNFNFGFAHVVDQKGLLLVNEKLEKMEDGQFTLGITPSEQDEPGDKIRPAPPNWNVMVKVDRARIYSVCDKSATDALARETKLPQVVAHELAHSLNIYHHGEEKDNPGLTSGDIKCIMRYDNWGVVNEVPGTILCTAINGANANKDRGNCAGQLRISGRIDPNQTNGFPEKKL